MLRGATITLSIAGAVFACAEHSGPVSLIESRVAAVNAQSAFSAVTQGPMTKPVGCAAGVTACGTADISGFGKGSFEFTITAFDRFPGCGAYDADVVFSLPDGSTLTLAETGTVCGPGGSFIPQPAPGGSYGNPVNGTATWTVVAASGQFLGVSGGGTNSFKQAGASLHGEYIGAS